MNRVRRSCADHDCHCVLCNCQRMAAEAVSFRIPDAYARFGSDIIRRGIRLPPGDLMTSVVKDEELFDALHIRGPDDSVVGLSLMLMLGRYCSVSIGYPDAADA